MYAFTDEIFKPLWDEKHSDYCGCEDCKIDACGDGKTTCYKASEYDRILDERHGFKRKIIKAFIAEIENWREWKELMEENSHFDFEEKAEGILSEVLDMEGWDEFFEGEKDELRDW